MTTPEPWHWRETRILTPKQAILRACHERALVRRIVTTNGSFDPLHLFHVGMLEEAKQQGDVLFVGIDSDDAVASKGPGRPRLTQRARAAFVAALACVDYVVLMTRGRDEEPARSLIQTVLPNVHVNSDEYGPPESWVEWPYLQKWGVQPFVVPRRQSLGVYPGLSEECETAGHLSS